MGKRTPTPSKRKHHNCPCRQQTRPRHRTPRQTRHHRLRRGSLRPRSRPFVLRDLSQDGRECAGIVHGDCEEVAPGAGGCQEYENPAAGGGFEAGGAGDARGGSL